jgi:hypothetical protein
MDPVKKIIPFATFVAIASPQAFELTRTLLGSWIASDEGVPKLGGLLLHALVFVILTHLLWSFFYGPKTARSSCGCGMA